MMVNPIDYAPDKGNKSWIGVLIAIILVGGAITVALINRGGFTTADPQPGHTTATIPGSGPTAAAVGDLPVTTAPSDELTRYYSQSQVPPSGSTMDIAVETGTLHVLTSGPICLAGVRLTGGEGRGSVVIMLPGATYHVTCLLPRLNWHGAYTGPADSWKQLADDRVSAMFAPNNCGDQGCKVVDLLVVGPNGVVNRQTLNSTTQ